MAGEKILIIDDDSDIREIITLYMEEEGYQVVSAENGSTGIKSAVTYLPDLIILDMMLPDLDGIEVCQEIRKELSVPILFLSCKSTANDKAIGLIAGGDDYMSKPFEAMELLARIKAHLRRSRMANTSASRNHSANLLIYDDLAIDLNSFNVFLNGEAVNLSPKEFQLLALLAKSPGKVFQFEELYQSVWGIESFGDNRTLMVHISNIRKKIEEDPKRPEFIQTIKGIGYKFITEGGGRTKSWTSVGL